MSDPASRPNGWTVWLAQGFGVGRSPVAPGTLAAAPGLAWFLALVSLGSGWAFAAACAASLILAVPVCSAAENRLQRHDPPSIVLDEIVALPLCFVSWLAYCAKDLERWPEPSYFLTGSHLPLTLALIAGFRAFDIWKPWPVRQSQALWGGLGVVADDALAAAWVNLMWYVGAVILLP
ncbi:MAG: phosphatidylglycerophosphatase A [Verrucomicrobia bacterium]|nr:phosphatidylglycerophosphatase A [Verrucomicrobiota bacterium]